MIISIGNLATNWTDVDGNPVSLAGINLVPTNGVTLIPINLTTNLDGSYVITDNVFLGYINTNNVNDQFSYVISDGQGGTATELINVVMNPFVNGQNATVIVGGSTATVNFAGIPEFSYGVQRSTNLAGC